MNELDLDEKLAFVTRATREMASHTFPYVATIAAVENEASGFAIGSGLRVRDGDRRWIVSADHVVAAARARAGRVAATAVRGGHPVELRGEPIRDVGTDLCAFAVGQEFPDVAFWPLEDRDEDDVELSRDFLFVHGFPQTRGHFSPTLEALMTKSLPYGAMRRTEELPDDLGPHQFAIEFEAATLRSVEGGLADWERPHGLSGSPVWRIGATGRVASDWRPSNGKLVGILTQWRPKDELIVASHVDRLVALLRS